MKLERVELLKVEGRLSRVAPGGARSWSSRRGVRVRLRAQGLVGLGEAAPLPGYSPDSLADVRAALAELSSRELHMSLEGSASACVLPLLSAIPAELPSARFALETALLDLRSRARERPVHRLLSGAPASEQRVAALIASEDASGALEDASRALAAGAAALKFKIASEVDWQRVEAVRRALPEVPLRLDFNQGHSEEAAPAALARAANLGVELVEEPSPAWIGPQAEPPLCLVFLDESLRDARTRGELPGRVARGEVAGAVLKPALIGGVLKCLALAERVRGAGGQCFVTHLFDGPVARAAAAELALALGGRLAHGLAPHAGLEIWPAFEAHAIQGYRLAPHGEPGLGREQKS